MYIKPYLISKQLLHKVKVAYTNCDDESYVILHPNSLREFKLI